VKRVELANSVLSVVLGTDQLMFAVIFTIGIWFRIDIVYIPGYGIIHSFDWWALYVAVMSQVTYFYSFTCL